MNTKIKNVKAREVLDSRGNPTVEVDIDLECGAKARATCPSGASTGVHEAVELRDGDRTRFNGKGVRSAIGIINREIASLIHGMDATDQAAVDEKLIVGDGTVNKSRFGANSTVAVSMAVARAASSAEGKHLWEYLGGPKANLLPVPMMNVLNGGVHANWQGPDFQEYMIVPFGAADFSEALRWGAEVYQALKKVLTNEGFNTAVGDEGGFVINASSNDIPLDLILKAIEKAGYNGGNEVAIALDPASSAFYEDGYYLLGSKRKSGRSNQAIANEAARLSSLEMIERYSKLIERYPIISIEDGLAEDDWDGWKHLTRELGSKIELVGDDIFVTHVKRIGRGIEEKTANAVLIKPNQIGTITETIAAIKLAQNNGWGVELSHRSGETVDSFIADLTVATGAGHIKAGAPCRGERVEKYNQLLRIEESLGSMARFAGRDAIIR